MLNKKQWLGVALAYTLFVFMASLASIHIKVAPTFEHKDKIVHIGIYVLYTIIWFFYFNSGLQKISYKKAILLAFATGILIEILQGSCTQNRSADIFDVVANSIGISIAVFLIKHFYPKIQHHK